MILPWVGVVLLIPFFSRVASPLYALTCKDVPFEWSDACEDVFTQLKMLLTQASILAFPNFSRDFHLEMDASGLGLGAILRLWSTVWQTHAHVGQSPYKTLGYMRMNFSRQFARTIINHETVCKAVLILQQQR